ncbi:MAG: hypothetical protein ACTSU9_06325 [Promethearchaeota archaeon]
MAVKVGHPVFHPGLLEGGRAGVDPGGLQLVGGAGNLTQIL